MIRRVFAMLLAMTLWSIQTADAGVLHVGSDNSAISIQADDDTQASVAVADDGVGTVDSDGPPSCNDSCPCHALHHVYIAVTQSESDLNVIARVYTFSHDARPEHLSAPLSRPPLA